MDARRSTSQRIRLLLRPGADVARVAVLVVSIGLASSAAPVLVGAYPGAAGAPPPPAAAPVAAPVEPASVLSPELAARDALEFGAVARFLEIASGPTPVPSPTPEPPPPPAPAPVVERGPEPPAQPAVAVPAAAPPPVVPEAPSAAPPPVAPPPAAPPPPPAPAAPRGLNTAPMDASSQELFNDTNARRRANGLAPLRVNGYLIGVARIRSQDMADHNYFAHVSPVTGDNAFTIMDAHGVLYGWAGENLAKNNYPDSQAVAVADEALWNSAPHRANILNPNYTDMGIALAVDGAGVKYFTIIFTGPA